LRTHGCNTFGRRQFPEKIIPLFILRALSGMTLPVYGKGLNVREWISVDDHADGLIAALQKGRPGQSYNLSSGVETSNLDLVGLICEILGDVADSTEAVKFCDLIEFVQDRPGHDLRYAMDISKSAADLNWRVTTDLRQGVIDTVEWYLNNKDWWLPITEVTYDLSRIGVGDE
jgi:dTDP-glucose 4,6-dehydratase